ncbi:MULTISPECIES: hypothetical protein [unclassified Thiocapsa]|uniref:hypothetical protein n=1 Tax=unclassified Thiocapsa TaxID=2641286 RepID=UPI0035AEC020
MTVERTLYDDGIASLGPRLRFATYGEPVFDAILAMSADWQPPGCLRRIAVTPQGLDVEYVAFVAACAQGEGTALRVPVTYDRVTTDFVSFDSQTQDQRGELLGRSRAASTVESRPGCGGSRR